MPHNVIEARGLTKHFGDLEAVAGIDFGVRRGECFGFLGPNGAGKSTTMRMIYRATPIGSGSLRILDHEVGQAGSDRKIKRRLGVVPQEDNLDQELTVRENLEVFARFHRLSRRAADQRIAELLEFGGLLEKADVRAIALSGGLRRRTLIARGLIGTPDIVVLDEPTTGLDPQARHRLWDQLIELKRHDTTLVLTTHYMDEAEKLCDRLVIMDRGKIVAEGKPAELIRSYSEPFVVEVRSDSAAELEAAERQLADTVERQQRLADRVLLYTGDGEAVIAEVVHRCPSCEATLRRATLEDVFLEISGRSLHD